MPYTGEAKNIMLDAIARGTAPASSAGFVGLLGQDAGKAITAVGATGVFTSAAHGYANGDLVVLSGLAGGSGFTVGRLYRVTNVTTNTFTVAMTTGGATVLGGTDITAGTVARLVELSGGTYARIGTAFAAAVGGINDDSTSHVVNVPAGATVAWVGYWSALTVGTLLAASDVTDEAYASAGTYTVTDAKLDLLAVA